MKEKRNDGLDEFMKVLDSMAECAGKMIAVTKEMIVLLSSGKLQVNNNCVESIPVKDESNPSNTVEQETQTSEAETSCTFEEVRGIMASLSSKGKKVEAKELLQKFGAKRLSEVQEKDYAALASAAKAVMNG